MNKYEYENVYRQRSQSGRDNRVGRGVQEHTYPPNYREPSSTMEQLERWVSGVGGAAILVYGLRQNNLSRWPLAALGAGLIYQGASGQNLLEYLPISEEIPVVNQLTSRAPTKLHVRKSVTIGRPADELYNYWRKLENLPSFMNHVKSVRDLGNGRSHWVVNVIRDMELEWDAEITVDRPNEMIAWQTLPEASLQNLGYVKFIPTSRGTEVSVALEYDPPGAAAGALAGRAVKFIAEMQIKEEIRNFKRLMETGELPTTDGQPSGRRDEWPSAWRNESPNNLKEKAQRQEARQ